MGRQKSSLDCIPSVEAIKTALSCRQNEVKELELLLRIAKLVEEFRAKGVNDGRSNE